MRAFQTRHYTRIKNLEKILTLFLRLLFRCSEAGALFVFNEIKKKKKPGSRLRLLLPLASADQPPAIWVSD